MIYLRRNLSEDKEWYNSEEYERYEEVGGKYKRVGEDEEVI